MISLDMKYTSLYWALRFIEKELDIHVKRYIEYEITIKAEKQEVHYGSKIKVINPQCNFLIRHKDFVILELVDRLLTKGYNPSDIQIDGRSGHPDIIVNEFFFYCEEWVEGYDNARIKFKSNPENNYKILYTSRLVSGLLEFKNLITWNNDFYNYGIIEKEIPLFQPLLSKSRDISIQNVSDINDFEIFEGELINYNGKSKIVKVPEGIISLGSSSFWNNTHIEEVILPDNLVQLGGDAFYYCSNLVRVNIPVNAKVMGNNPFAGCPKLIISNFSDFFTLENGVLFNKEKTLLIHYPISKEDIEYSIPDTVVSLGKHCFYNCNNLKKVIIPESVIRFENNVFADCKNLDVENKSPYYHIENGIIYNKFRTAIIGVLFKTTMEKYVVPDSITLISRNSFWNCKGIKKIVLTENIKVIGYNPFAGCDNLTFESENDRLRVENSILYNHDYTELICCTNIVSKEQVKIRDTVKYINRGAFSGCKDLAKIDFNQVIDIAKSSFTNCSSLTSLYIPDTVKHIGEWAFAYCNNLERVEINKVTVIDKNAFNECPAVIIRRG